MVDIACEQPQPKLAGEEPLVCFAGRQGFVIVCLSVCVFECLCLCLCLCLRLRVFIAVCLSVSLFVFLFLFASVCRRKTISLLCWVASVYNKAPSMGLSISLSIWQPLHYQQTNHSQLSSLLCCVESHLLYRIVSTQQLWS